MTNTLTTLTPPATPFNMSDLTPTPKLDSTIEQMEQRLKSILVIPQSAKARRLLKGKIESLKSYRERYQAQQLEAQQRASELVSELHYYQDPVTNRQLSFNPNKF